MVLFSFAKYSSQSTLSIFDRELLQGKHKCIVCVTLFDRVCVKPTSLYNNGMKPLMYSVHDAETNGLGWRRWGDEIIYYRNNLPYVKHDE
jgi:hypothetical protein